jgi:hypothetical protein
MALTTQLVLVAGDKVPTFELRSCRDAQSLDPTQTTAVRICMDDERSARSELEKQWLSFPAADRHSCGTEARAGGLPSYVELLVCLQDAQIARQIEATSKL